MKFETLNMYRHDFSFFRNVLEMSKFLQVEKNEVIFNLNQSLAVRREMSKPAVIVIDGLISSGKCLTPSTIIPLYNGEFKEAKDIEVGDFILGDDSLHREVLSTCSGVDEMFEIVPMRGENFTVNKAHILTLQIPSNPAIAIGKNKSGNNSRYRVISADKTGIHSKDFTFSLLGEEESLVEAREYHASLAGQVDVFDISVEDFLKRPKLWQSRCHLFHVGFDWPLQKVDFDPWILGHWLGDGTSAEAAMTSADPELIARYEKFAATIGCTVKQKGSSSITYSINPGYNKGTNKFLNFLKQYNLLKNKHIPKEYVLTDKDTRLQVLAGLIDSDGHLAKDAYYEIVQKNKRLDKLLKMI